MNGWASNLVKPAAYTDVVPPAAIADQTNAKARGVQVIIDITAYTSGSVTVAIKGKDQTSGKYFTLLTSAALSAVATTVLRVYPGLAAATNLTVNDNLPMTWTVTVTLAGGTTATFSVGANVLI